MAADKVELRGLTRTEMVEFLDAAALARNLDRNTLVNRILEDWILIEARKWTVMHRTLRNNAYLAEASAPTTNAGDLS